MVDDGTVRQWLADVATGKKHHAHFEDWVAVVLWQVNSDSPPETVALLREIDALFRAYDAKRLSLQGLLAEFAALSRGPRPRRRG